MTFGKFIYFNIIQIEMDEQTSPTQNPLIDYVGDYERFVETRAAMHLRSNQRDLYLLKSTEDIPAFINPKIRRFKFWAQIADLRNRKGISPKQKFTKEERHAIFLETLKHFDFYPPADLSEHFDFANFDADDFRERYNPNEKALKFAILAMKHAMEMRIRSYQDWLGYQQYREIETWADLIRARFDSPEHYLGSLLNIAGAEKSLARIIEPESSKTSTYHHYCEAREYGRKEVANHCFIEAVIEDEEEFDQDLYDKLKRLRDTEPK